METRKRWSVKRKRFYTIRPDEDRFWEKVDKKGPDECWPWLGCGHTKNERGAFYFRGQWTNAARAAVEISGRTIGNKKLACHKCDNPNCVNPKHLYVGTYTDNIKDAYARGQQPRKDRGKRGSFHHRAKLTEENVLEIRKMHKTKKFTLEEISNKFSVKTNAIFCIIHKHTWGHVN